MSLYEQMRIRFIENNIRDLLRISYPQHFCRKNYKFTNCMAYAFGLRQEDPGGNYYVPGAISKGFVLLKEEAIVDSVIADLKLLGIRCQKISEEEAKNKNKENNQIVALFYFNDGKKVNFHFIRKDKEGGWSHKPNFFDSPSKIKFDHNDIIPKFKLIAYLSASLN